MFPPGTRIATAQGEVPVEALKPGGRAVTRDNGIQLVRGAGRRDLSAGAMASSPYFQPIWIRAGSLGLMHPKRTYR